MGLGVRLCGGLPVHARVRHALARVLYRYGLVVGNYPWPFVLLPLLTLAALGGGVVTAVSHYDSAWAEDANFPHNSQSYKDKATMASRFPDRSADNYDALELIEDQIMGTVIFQARNNGSIYDPDVIGEIRRVINDVKSNVTTSALDGVSGKERVFRYEDLCGKQRGGCVVTGERLLAPRFDAMRHLRILTFPKWKIPTTGDIVDLSFALADADRYLQRVGIIRLTFKLRHDLKPLVFAWEDAFMEHMKKVKLNATDVVFLASQSLRQELDRCFRSDVVWMWACLGVMALVTCLVTCGGDAASTRAFFAPLALATPALGTVSSLGVVSMGGGRAVDMVWATPVLVMAVGLVNTWLLLTSWSCHLKDSVTVCHVPKRLGLCLTDVGMSISVSSLAMGVTMCAAYSVSFPSVANTALFAGVGVLLCYTCTMTFTVGCLALHARRVLSSRHALTCQVTAASDQLKKEGRGQCWTLLCAGVVPIDSYADQGWLERGPRHLLVRLAHSLLARVVTCVLYTAMLAAAIYGLLHIRSDLDIKDLVQPGSFISNYLHVDSRYFGFSFPVSFVVTKGAVYNQETVNRMSKLLAIAQHDTTVEKDFVRCWLIDFNKSEHRANLSLANILPVQINLNVGIAAFSNQSTPVARSNLSELATTSSSPTSTTTVQPSLMSSLPNTTEEPDQAPNIVDITLDKFSPFPQAVLKSFVATSDEYQGDVVWDDAGEDILASRCYVFSTKTSQQDELIGLMERMRSLAREAGFPVFAYHPSFLSFDQSLSVLPMLYRVAGVAVGVTFLLFLVAFPSVVLMLVVVVANTVTSIVTLMGFMTFTSVPASFVSMTTVVLCVGTAVYFSVPVTSAYMQSQHSQRSQRVSDAVSRAGVPLFNGGLVILLGLLLLLPATSYVFLAFFKISIIAVAVNIFLAALVTPAILSWVGHEKSQQEKDRDDVLRAELLKQCGAEGDIQLHDCVSKTGYLHSNGKNKGIEGATATSPSQQLKKANAIAAGKMNVPGMTSASVKSIGFIDPSCVYCSEKERTEYLGRASSQSQFVNMGTFPRNDCVMDNSDQVKHADMSTSVYANDCKEILANAIKDYACSPNSFLRHGGFEHEDAKHSDPSCVYCMFPRPAARSVHKHRPQPSGSHYHSLPVHSGINAYGQPAEPIYDIPVEGSRHRGSHHLTAAIAGSSCTHSPALQENQHILVTEPEYVNVPEYITLRNILQAESGLGRRPAHSPLLLAPPVPWRNRDPSVTRDMEQRVCQQTNVQYKNDSRVRDYSQASSEMSEIRRTPSRLQEWATSLESARQVACTLSDQGYLGGSQQYVTQNLVDFPA